MSRAVYQLTQARMLLDPTFTRAVAAGDVGDDGAGLTDLERERLVEQAGHPGFALTRKLHEGWRLTKLLTLLPTTFAVDPEGELVDLVLVFWTRRPPRSLYFEAEAADFARLVIATARSSALRTAAQHDLARVE